MRQHYKRWLEAQDYGAGTVASQLHRAGRVEDHYGDLDQHFRFDRLEGVIRALRYSSQDERAGRPNPSKIPFEGNARSNLASYRNAVENYRRFLSEFADETPILSGPSEVFADPLPIPSIDTEEGAQRIGLERDMQTALRRAIGQLENGLTIVDGGAERVVESGRIDITARDAAGCIVVIELKAARAGQRAVAQILSYMGDVSLEEPDVNVRGILVASDFDHKALAAVRMTPALALRTYSVRFAFDDAG